jgi:PAS domain S-box-containing protein
MGWDDLSSQALFAALPDPAIVFSVDGQVVAANQCAADLFERDMPFPQINVTELLAQPERKRLDPLAWMQKWADAPHAPELAYVYLICRTATGAEKQLSVRVARLSPDSADTFYLVTMHDVSRWEERLRSERDAHRVASQVLAITADAVIVVDEDTRITYANSSAERLLAYPAGALVDRFLGDLMPERYRSGHAGFMQQFASETRPARLMGDRRPIVALTSDGVEIPVEASISRVTVQGKPVFSAQLRDLRKRSDA